MAFAKSDNGKMSKQQCEGRTKNGARCRNSALPANRYCHVHSPAVANNKNNGRAPYVSRALFYPFIEIDDEAWLKTQCLYWDTISTIVPEGTNCYSKPEAKYLQSAGILVPFNVNPEMSDVVEAGGEAQRYLYTAEGRRLFEGTAKPVDIHSRKLTDRLARRLHDLKVSQTLKEVLDAAGGQRTGVWREVPPGFARYYMTLLAACIARNRGYSIVTQLPIPQMLATRVMLGTSPGLEYSLDVPSEIAEGLLAHVTLRTLSLGRGASVQKLVAFRERHETLLGKFRNAMRTLIDIDGTNLTPDALQAYITAVHRDQLLPALDELKGRLKDCRMSFGYNNLKVSTLASVGPTVLGTVLAGTIAGPIALAVGVGLSVALSIANYNIQRREFLRASPLAYLVVAEDWFGRARSS